MIRAVFAGQPGPARDIVILNAGAAIYAAGIAPSLVEGVSQAAGVIASGKANEVFQKLVEVSNSF